jgi:hypothetical protein
MAGGKGWKTARQAEQDAKAAARRRQFREAKKGKGPAPGYREANAGCLLGLAVLPVALMRRWLA